MPCPNAVSISHRYKFAVWSGSIEIRTKKLCFGESAPNRTGKFWANLEPCSQPITRFLSLTTTNQRARHLTRSALGGAHCAHSSRTTVTDSNYLHRTCLNCASNHSTSNLNSFNNSFNTTVKHYCTTVYRLSVIFRLFFHNCLSSNIFMFKFRTLLPRKDCEDKQVVV